MMKPLVTVVMPTYRRPDQIEQSIRSLLAGELQDFELLVRDDGPGNDGTEEAVRIAAQGNARVRYHRNERNLRMPENLNSGIREASGEYIAVCHDHDLYKTQFLSRMVAALEAYPQALFVHSAIEVVDHEDVVCGRHLADWPEITPGQQWLKIMLRALACPVCALTVVRRKAHEQFGLYDARYGFISDVEMWMRLARHGDVAYIRDPLIQVRTREAEHPELANWAKWARAAAEIHRQYIPCAYHGPKRLMRKAALEYRVARALVRGFGHSGWNKLRKQFA
jgi:glycosyltransferase involved in cell wall biosynthesis